MRRREEEKRIEHTILFVWRDLIKNPKEESENLDVGMVAVAVADGVVDGVKESEKREDRSTEDRRKSSDFGGTWLDEDDS